MRFIQGRNPSHSHSSHSTGEGSLVPRSAGSSSANCNEGPLDGIYHSLYIPVVLAPDTFHAFTSAVANEMAGIIQ